MHIVCRTTIQGGDLHEHPSNAITLSSIAFTTVHTPYPTPYVADDGRASFSGDEVPTCSYPSVNGDRDEETSLRYLTRRNNPLYGPPHERWIKRVVTG